MDDIINVSFDEFLDKVSGTNGSILSDSLNTVYPSNLSLIEIYNYLEKITDNFDVEKVSITLKSVRTYLDKLNNSYDFNFYFYSKKYPDKILKKVDAFKLDQFVELISILENKLETCLSDKQKGIIVCKENIGPDNLFKLKRNSIKGTPQDILENFDSYVIKDYDKNESVSDNYFLFVDDIKAGLKLILETNRLLSLEDSLQKLIKLIHHCALLMDLKVFYQKKCDEYEQFKKLTKLERGSLDFKIQNVDTEIKKLEHLEKLNGLKNQPFNLETNIFLTKLNEKEQLIKCDEIINKKGFVTEQVYNGFGDKGTTIETKVFEDVKEKHRPTVMYLLGGDYPDEVETMKVAVIANLSALLKQITDVDGTGKDIGKKVVPEFMKRFCIEHLRNSKGGLIKAIK